ncbi:Gfo/Idh/MocA family oxidoreductase [Microlunatus ginsengisoli]|uniref:Gfo/Idh/MocA family oxidoreductase n=1 Tax=Microlunatus ginsengisoli TaxID=363863 RepID=UPI0031DC448D
MFFGTGRQATNLALCLQKAVRESSAQSGLSFVGIDPDPERRQGFLDGLATLFPGSDLTAINSAQEPPPVASESTLGFVTCPARFHQEGISWMLRHGVDRIVVEKPIAANAADLRSIGDMLRSHPEMMCVQEQYLYSALFDELTELAQHPSDYLSRRCGRTVPRNAGIVSTTTHLHKDRVHDLDLGRHAENICLIELPHTLTLLFSAFGPLGIEDVRRRDLLHHGRIYPGYRDAHIVLRDRQGIEHRSDLSNVRPCRRTLTVTVSDGFSVELRFPGQLRPGTPSFHSVVTVRHHGQTQYRQRFRDDHLARAAASYLSWNDRRGTYAACFAPTELALRLTERR